jgi:hypothetical protein
VVVTVRPEAGVGLVWEGLRIKFEVAYARDRKPPTAKIQIWNLSESSRKFIQEQGDTVLLQAGYGLTAGGLFDGDIKRSVIEPGWPDVITKIEAGDGERATLESRISLTLGPGRTTRDQLRELVAATGLRTGVLPDLPDGRQFTGGLTMFGPVRNYLDELADELGADWWVADGQLNMVLQGESLPELAFLVTPDTGLIGSPSELTKTTSGRVRVIGVKWRMLLAHELRPGRICQLESREFSGQYTVEKVKFTGDSGYDQAFYADVEAVGRDV